MPANAYITASCLVHHGVVFRNAEKVFASGQTRPDDFFDDAYRHFDLAYPKFHKMDRLSKLGTLTAHVLLAGQTATLTADRTAVVLANANASLDTDERYFATVASMASPALFVYTLPNIMIGEISIRYGLKGENAFFVLKDFDANFITSYVADLFATGLADNCLCGWVDLLGDRYRSWMAFAEQRPNGAPVPFTAAGCDSLFNADHE